MPESLKNSPQALLFAHRGLFVSASRVRELALQAGISKKLLDDACKVFHVEHYQLPRALPVQEDIPDTLRAAHAAGKSLWHVPQAIPDPIPNRSGLTPGQNHPGNWVGRAGY
jgi:hypothetical protein